MLSAQSITEVINSYVTGDLFSLVLPTRLKWSSVMMAKRGLRPTSDTVFAGQLLGQGGPTPSLGGGFTVTEFFAEANVPLTENLTVTWRIATPITALSVGKTLTDLVWLATH